MKLKVKPIINSLSHATVTHEGFEATAIGYTKNEVRRFPAKILPFDSAQGASWLSGVEDSG